MAKYFVTLSSGEQFEISKLDFNKLKYRSTRGQTKGWYHQKGESMGERNQWSVQFEYISGFWSDEKTKADDPRENIDVDKYVPSEPKPKVEKPKDSKCKHDWNNVDDYEFVTQIVSGRNRYFKRCLKCEAKSQIIKTREVELAMEAEGKTLDQVPVIKG